jgi:hypothetical protein
MPWVAPSGLAAMPIHDASALMKRRSVAPVPDLSGRLAPEPRPARPGCRMDRRPRLAVALSLAMLDRSSESRGNRVGGAILEIHRAPMSVSCTAACASCAGVLDRSSTPHAPPASGEIRSIHRADRSICRRQVEQVFTSAHRSGRMAIQSVRGDVRFRQGPGTGNRRSRLLAGLVKKRAIAVTGNDSYALAA